MSGNSQPVRIVGGFVVTERLGGHHGVLDRTVTTALPMAAYRRDFKAVDAPVQPFRFSLACQILEFLAIE